MKDLLTLRNCICQNWPATQVEALAASSGADTQELFCGYTIRFGSAEPKHVHRTAIVDSIILSIVVKCNRRTVKE